MWYFTIAFNAQRTHELVFSSENGLLNFIQCYSLITYKIAQIAETAI